MNPKLLKFFIAFLFLSTPGMAQKTTPEKVVWLDSLISFNGLHAWNLSFEDSQINEVVYQTSSRFEGTYRIKNVNFLKQAVFSNNAYYFDFKLEADTFKEYTTFSKNMYAFWAQFQSDYFDSRVTFINDSFCSPAYFSHSKFLSSALFSNCSFQKTLQFDSCLLLGKMEFFKCHFSSGASFEGAIVMGDLDFRNSIATGSRIDLTTIRIDTISNSTIRRGLYLNSDDIPKIKLDYSRLYLKFDSATRFEDRSNVYQTLLNSFKNDGFTKSYEILDKEYRAFQYKNDKQYFLLWLDQHWWDFGYAKYYVFYWILGLVTGFSALNFFLYPFLNKAVYSIDGMKNHYPLSNWKKYPSRFYYSLVYTSILFFSLSVKLEKLQYRHWYAVVYIFLIYLLGIVCLAYSANFVLQK